MYCIISTYLRKTLQAVSSNMVPWNNVMDQLYSYAKCYYLSIYINLKILDKCKKKNSFYYTSQIFLSLLMFFPVEPIINIIQIMNTRLFKKNGCNVKKFNFVLWNNNGKCNRISDYVESLVLFYSKYYMHCLKNMKRGMLFYPCVYVYS